MDAASPGRASAAAGLAALAAMNKRHRDRSACEEAARAAVGGCGGGGAAALAVAELVEWQAHATERTRKGYRKVNPLGLTDEIDRELDAFERTHARL